MDGVRTRRFHNRLCSRWGGRFVCGISGPPPVMRSLSGRRSLLVQHKTPSPIYATLHLDIQGREDRDADPTVRETQQSNGSPGSCVDAILKLFLVKELGHDDVAVEDASLEGVDGLREGNCVSFWFRDTLYRSHT